MRNKLKITILIISTFLLSNFKVFAFGGVQIPNPTNIGSLEELVNAGANLIRPIFLITFTAMILYGAFIYLTARDDEAKVKSARSILIAAIIGFSIAVFAPALVDIVSTFLGVPGLSIGG